MCFFSLVFGLGFFCGGGFLGFYLVILFGWFCFFNPDRVHLLEVCTIPAGLATFSIVFVELQTSILCFPYVIFISRLDSKLRYNACSN